MGKRDLEKTTLGFVSAIKQVVPSYQRRIITFLAKNRDKKFSNAIIAKELGEDRSNIWKSLHSMVNENGEFSLIKETRERGDPKYSWNGDWLKVNEITLSNLLVTLEYLEEAKEKND